jgi:hypothetical protein
LETIWNILAILRANLYQEMNYSYIFDCKDDHIKGKAEENGVDEPSQNY